MKKTELKKTHIIQLVLSLVIISLAVFIASKLFFRIDLTSEHRFTLSKESKSILRNLDDVVYFKIYLDGNLPVGFKKLQNSIRETLDEFRVYGKDNIQYQFINPSASTDPRMRNKEYAELYDKGVHPEKIQVQGKDGSTSTQWIFPGAIISYNGVDIPVNLLHNNTMLSADQNLNNSTQNLEYEFIKTIQSLTSKKIQKIAFLEGQGELPEMKVKDISKELSNFFEIDRGSIHGKLGILKPYKVVIVARPTKPFSEQDKLVLDQYIMHGGKVLWLVDEVNVNVDSLAKGSTFAFINNLNINDQLFTYGARINPELIQDVQCDLIPVNTAMADEKPQWTLLPWLYYPIFSPLVNHPITRNLNLILTKFVSPIDTVGENPAVKKTFLLRTSAYTRTVNVPALISLSEVSKTPKQSEFNESHLPVAVLLEGKFRSVFRNRLVNSIIPHADSSFKAESVNTKMIVVAAGNIIANDVKMTSNGPVALPLGYDKYTDQTFGNKDFIVNAVNYLADKTGLMALREKNFKLRILNKGKIEAQRLTWQLINTLFPVVLVIAFGLYYVWSRKRKYSKR